MVVAAAVVGFGVDGGTQTLATVSDGVVVTPDDEPFSPPLLASTEAEYNVLAAEMASRGHRLPEIEPGRSFLVIAVWESCAHDRAHVRFHDGRMWVEEEPTNWLCEAPEPAFSPVVIRWSTVGDSFCLLAYDEPSAPALAVSDRTIPVNNRYPIAATSPSCP